MDTIRVPSSRRTHFPIPRIFASLTNGTSHETIFPFLLIPALNQTTHPHFPAIRTQGATFPSRWALRVPIGAIAGTKA